MAAIYASSKGACKGLKRPSTYKGCGNRQKRTPLGGDFFGRVRFRIFPEVDPATSQRDAECRFSKNFTIDVRFCSFPQPYISRGTFWGGVRMPVNLPPKADLFLDEADSDAPLSMALDT